MKDSTAGSELQIVGQIRMIESNLEELAGTLSGLEKRLSDVLRQVPDAKLEQTPPPSILVPFAKKLADIAAQIKSSELCLASIVSRLEL